MKDNNKSPIISLIIPVYNVELYLKRALDSVVNQTFKNIEVIIVNDGSTDSSYEIIKMYVENYSYFQVITQKNGGLSSARNAGIEVAKGEYIAFMDSDDYIAPTYLEELYNLAINSGADISYCNYNLYYPNYDFKLFMPFASRSTVYKRQKALKKLILDATIHYFSWNKLCKRSIFIDNNIFFPDMYFEDIAVSPKLFYHANKIAVTSKALYYYTIRKGSILRSIKPRTVNDYIRAFAGIRAFLENKNDFENYKTIYWLHSIRAKLVTYCLIFQMHFYAMNFTGILKNLLFASKDIDYFVDKKFIQCEGIIPEIPYTIDLPVKPKKCKSKKKKSNYFDIN